MLICLLKPKVEVNCEQFSRAAKVMSVRLFKKKKKQQQTNVIKFINFAEKVV